MIEISNSQILGIILGYFGYSWSMNNKIHPEYWRQYGRSPLVQNILQIFSTIIYPFTFFLLIIFGTNNHVEGLIIALVLNYIIFPFIHGFTH